MKKNWIATASALAFAVSTALHADVVPTYQTDSSWYTDAQTKLATKLQTNNQFKAKNVTSIFCPPTN